MSQPMIAYHFDLKRAMWTRGYMDAVVDRLVDWGFNTLLYEVEDKFRFANHPAIAHPDAPSHAEITAFVAACRAKGVEVIPLVQTLGHAEYVVGKPEYAHLRETPEVDNQYDPLSPEAQALILELIDEVIAVFQPRTCFHLGGDETWSLGKSAKCAETVARIGAGGLYFQHMQPLFAHLQAKGLRPIIWADVAITHPEMIERIPHDVVMMDWDYWTTSERPSSINVWAHNPATGAPCWQVAWEQYDDVVPPEFRQYLEPFAVDEQTRRDGTYRAFCYTDALRAMGFDVITAPANRSYGDMVGIPNYQTHLPNCYYAARKAADGFGFTMTSWAVRHNHPETTVFSTYAAVQAIDGAPYDPAALGAAFCRDFYGVARADFTDLIMAAQAGFDCTREFGIRIMQQRLANGEDPLSAAIDSLVEQHGSREQVLAAIDAMREGYRRAHEGFTDIRAKATRNAENLDFWLEGLDLHLFYVDVLRAAVTGEVFAQRQTLLARLAALRARTRALFAPTYLPVGLQQELDLRYGAHERYLQLTQTAV